ncbi:hypothetical protein [Arthrobacter sp. HLT1-20]
MVPDKFHTKKISKYETRRIQMEKPRKEEQMNSKSSYVGSNEIAISAIEGAAEVARGMESKEDELMTVIGKTGVVWSVIGIDHSVKFPPVDEVDPLVDALPKSHDTPFTQTSW